VLRNVSLAVARSVVRMWWCLEAAVACAVNAKIHEADAVLIKLLGYRQVLRGHVDSIARGINVPNAQPDVAGLASANPIFTWVRLAQRVPVRVHIDDVPADVRLVVGLTATVEINLREAQ
jgi:multidrug resistance efflux pump